MKIQLMTDIPDFPLPKRATDGSAGFDLHAAIDKEVIVSQGNIHLIPTGYAFAIPYGYVGLLFPRSGKSTREGMTLANAVGVIDSDFTGEVVAAVTNRHRNGYVSIKPLERFCQLVVVPISREEVCLVESLSETVRGGGGFGSTGMNLQDLGKPLAIHQIDFRVQSINRGGYATVLAYKDARVDMDRLDEVVGRGRWQRKHEVINGHLFCSVGIYDPEIGQWVWVQDVGVPSNSEATKGEASDAFKRACFNLGIGRELYEYPPIQVKLNDTEWEMKNDRPTAKWGLKIRDWVWYAEHEGNVPSFLAAKDGSDQVRFKWGTQGRGVVIQ